MTTGTRTTTRRVGPYEVITGLDDRLTHIPVPELRYIARSIDGDRTVVLSMPLRESDPQRFMAEATASRYLLGPAAAPPTEFPAPGDLTAWHARPYLPALPLPTALAVHGGPLPESAVRAIGTALAETLSIGHGQGLVHAGVSPGAVLLMVDGPRLTCFGAVRVAAPDGVSRTGLPGLEPGSLPPEQATGGRPRPLGDVYALGATLAYAATGHTTPERDEIPPGLRAIVARCLSRDPQARPQLSELLDALRPGAGPLPGRVVAAVAHQSAVLLSAEIQPMQAPPAGSRPPYVPGPAHPAPWTPPPTP